MSVRPRDDFAQALLSPDPAGRDALLDALEAAFDETRRRELVRFRAAAPAQGAVVFVIFAAMVCVHDFLGHAARGCDHEALERFLPHLRREFDLCQGGNGGAGAAGSAGAGAEPRYPLPCIFATKMLALYQQL